MKPALSAFLFDLDGVIVDSMPLHTEAWKVYLRNLGIAANDAEIEGAMHGRRNDEIVRHFISPRLPREEVEAHGSAKERLFRDMMTTELARHLVPGVREFLAVSRDTPAAVVSNAELPNIDFVLDGTGLRSRFQALVDGHQAVHAKPAPDLYLRAAELLGVPASACVVFEDSPPGIEAGRAAGARVVGVATHRDDLPDVDLLIRDFEDPALLPWLAALPRAVK